MKLLKDILESEDKLVTPEVKWKTNGDGSYTVRVDYGNDRVFVHTNKKREVLEKILKDRYGPRKSNNA